MTGSIQVDGGPAGPGMSGGPVVDEWGKVVGLVEGDSLHGHQIVVIPLRTISRVASQIDVNGQAMYIGPPLITASPSQLVLGPSYFTGRNPKQSGNDISYVVGSIYGSYYRGNLWLWVFPTISAAALNAANCQANLGKGWSGVANSAYSVGDGGRLITAYDYSGQTILISCWSDRNAAVVWLVETRNYDDSKFFQSVAGSQEQILYEAT